MSKIPIYCARFKWNIINILGNGFVLQPANPPPKIPFPENSQAKGICIFLSFEWNSIRLGGSVHGIVTKTVHKTMPGGGGGQGGRGGREVGGGGQGVGMVG